LLPTSIRESIRLVRNIDPQFRAALFLSAIRRLVGRDTSGLLPVGLRDRPTVVFICRGNLYRSPMAMALMVEMTNPANPAGITLASAGLRARPGRPAPSDACAVAREFQVSLDAHRATPLTAEMVAAADVLVIMDRENEAELLSRFPASKSRAVLLGSFDRSGNAPATIADPYAKGDQAVRDCYSRIQRSVAGLHAALSRLPSPDDGISASTAGLSR
jgi:protein-tyrosine phosphatase